MNNLTKIKESREELRAVLDVARNDLVVDLDILADSYAEKHLRLKETLPLEKPKKSSYSVEGQQILYALGSFGLVGDFIGLLVYLSSIPHGIGYSDGWSTVLGLFGVLVLSICAVIPYILTKRKYIIV